jgi:hypothetical protein
MNCGTLPPQMLVARARGAIFRCCSTAVCAPERLSLSAGLRRELAQLLKNGDFGADTSLLQEALRPALEDGRSSSPLDGGS